MPTTDDNSILSSVKANLPAAIPPDDHTYDSALIDIINSVFSTIHQICYLGPEEGFAITGEVEKWSDFEENLTDKHLLETYVYDKVRLEFDPPQSATLMNAIQERIHEKEYRLSLLKGGNSDE